MRLVATSMCCCRFEVGQRSLAVKVQAVCKTCCMTFPSSVLPIPSKDSPSPDRNEKHEALTREKKQRQLSSILQPSLIPQTWGTTLTRRRVLSATVALIVTTDGKSCQHLPPLPGLILQTQCATLTNLPSSPLAKVTSCFDQPGGIHRSL